MTKWVCKWKPFWVLRGGTFQKAYLEEWEQEADDQNHVHCEESNSSHKSCSASRTTAAEGLHAVKDDGWSATRGIPAPRGCLSFPQSSRQPFGDTIETTKVWKHIQKLQKVQCFGSLWAHQCLRKTVFAIVISQYSLASFPSDHLCRTLTRRSHLASRKTSRPYEMVFQFG